MKSKTIIFAFLFTLLFLSPIYAEWQFYEKTNVKGTISGIVKKGFVIQMESGSIYEVTDLTIQVVVEVQPEAIVLIDEPEFKVIIEGFDEPLICKQLVAPKNYSFESKPKEDQKGLAVNKEFFDISLEKLMSEEQQSEIGISKLSKEEKEKLRIFILNTTLYAFELGKQNQLRQEIPSKTESPKTVSVIQSSIDGEFNGWEGETIIKLMNGQIWQQSEYYYHYHYAYMPEVFIYKDGARWKMRVDGVDKAVGVTRLK